MFDDVRMRGFRQRADLDDVVAWVDALPAPTRAETVPLADAAGRVLVADLVSPLDVPAFARSAMDGWAVRAEETFGAGATDPLRLRVVGTALPGRPFAGVMHPGQAVGIMTGAPLPAGADAVLRAEDGAQDGDEVDVHAAVARGRHVGEAGEDVVRGQRLLAAGRRLRPQDVGLASAIGCAALAVRSRPRVDLLVTGDELLPAGSQPQGARIVDSNSPMLRALVERDGGALSSFALVADDEARLREALEATRGDVVIVTGGSSVGVEDHAPRLLAALGELAFHGIAVRPAAPAGLGRLGGRAVFLLPGNPVSCLCAYDLLVGRLIRRQGGRALAWPYPTRRLPLRRKVASVLGRVDYVRVRVVDEEVEPLMARGASILSSTTEADGFVLVPRDLEGWPAGHLVDVALYDVG